MYRMMDLSELETFVAAIRAGSFAAAARQLGVTPAMVGRRIQNLEDRHGTRLIERTTRRQRLTETGEAFLAQAETVLDAVGELEDIARSETGGLSGRIRATGPTTLGIHRLSAIVARFCAEHPAVTVELSLSDRRADIIAEGHDLAVRIGELSPSSLIARPVGTYGLQCVAAPAYLERHGTPAHPQDLAQHRCILNLNMSPRGRWPFFGPGGGAIVAEVKGGLQIDNGEAQLVAALAGAGIVYLPTELVSEPLAQGRLRAVLPHWKTLSLPINIVYPSRRFVPRRLRAFMDAIATGLAARA
jgi:DNA-binding transcriptional LysR family regulator